MKTNSMISKELLEILACPDCREDLHERCGDLACTGCGRCFDVRNGIPILFSKHVNQERLEKEEKLGESMKRPKPSLSGKELFSEDQWRESKNEFWEYVESSLVTRLPRTIINIGCGIDTRFLQLRELGHMVIAFDLIFNLLDTLRAEHGSRYNIAGAVQALPFKKNSLDALCCIDLIHHEYAGIPRILESFRSILKPGGYLFLEDINAWGLYQFPKSIVLPKRLHRALRSSYHRLRRSSHRPADYEFPTSVWWTRKTLAELGFRDITVVPQRTYPNVCPVGWKLYTILARSEYVRRYHNFHYMIAARKAQPEAKSPQQD